MRDTKTEEYRKLLEKAVNTDIEQACLAPSFYALVIHSNFKNPIFNQMEELTKY